MKITEVKVSLVQGGKYITIPMSLCQPWFRLMCVLPYPIFFCQEFMSNDAPWRDTVIDHPIAEMVYDGMLHLSEPSGLGVDLVVEKNVEKSWYCGKSTCKFLHLDGFQRSKIKNGKFKR